MSSTRLAGKMLLPLGGWPLIAWPLRRLAAVGSIVCCTATTAADDPLVELVESLGVSVVRGSEHDVLGRFHAALEHFPQQKWLLRATGDNPLVLPELALAALDVARAADADYCSIEGSALGTTVEVIQRRALATLHLLATLPEEREHCTLGLLRRPERFRIVQFAVPDTFQSAARLTVDTATDLAYCTALIGADTREPERWTWPELAARIALVEPPGDITQHHLAEVQQLKERAWLATPTPR